MRDGLFASPRQSDAFVKHTPVATDDLTAGPRRGIWEASPGAAAAYQSAPPPKAPAMPPSPLKASDLRTLAQYLLSAAQQLQRQTLGNPAIGLLSEWVKASEHLKSITGEGPQSYSAIVSKRAIGMLLRGQAARDAAVDSLSTELAGNDALKQALADGDWDGAAHGMATIVISDYHAALEKGQG